jgi:flagellar assembly factor FliW
VTHAPSPITFADGLVGFAGPQRFALVPWGGDGSPFSLLQSLDDESLAFVVVPPAVFFGDYDPELDDEVAARVGLTSPADAVVLVIVTVPEDAREATANLLGPLVINVVTRQGVQAVLDPERWPSRKRLLEPAATSAA